MYLCFYFYAKFKVKEKQGLIQTLHIVKYDLIELFQKATLLNYEDDENNLSNLLLDLIDYIEESQTNS